MTQPDLWDDGPAAWREVPAAGTVRERTERLLELNPWLLPALVKITRDLVSRGHRRVGIGMVVEVVRWTYQRGTTDPNSRFKVDNRYRAHLARIIGEREPDLAGVFETRKLHKD
jgi:hypothetical protein